MRDRGKEDRAATLTAAIVADVRAQAALVGPRRLASVFLGGGTPSLMDPADVATVV